MKQKFFSVCLLLSIGFFSCSQDNEIFSCDKEVNTWVKENLADIVQMERTQWLNMGSISYQRAAYRAFTPEQKQALWIGKLDEILSNVVWTQEETKHIEYMLDFVKKKLILFQEKINQEDMDEFEIEMYKWKEYAVEELGWTPELLYAIINTPQSINSNRQIIFVVSSVTKLKNGSESGSIEDCDCNASALPPQSSGDWFPCVRVIHKCNTGSGCKKTTWGCGNLWLYECNGTCV